MKILPELNLLRDEKKGRDYAFTYVNHLGNKTDIRKHFSKNYSNQDEEELFREAEEKRLVDKNTSLVSEIISTSIKSEYKGIRDKELREILTNTKKKSEVSKALKSKYKFYSPQTKYEYLRSERNRVGLLDTAIEEGMDLNDPEQVNYNNLFEKTYAQTEDSEIEDASNNRLNFHGDREGVSSHPMGHPSARFYQYDANISFEDYQDDLPEYGFASFKNMRYEYRTKEELDRFNFEHTRKFGNPENKELEGFFVPHLEKDNEDAEDKIFKKNNFNTFKTRKNLYSKELSEISDFVDFKVSQDVSKDSDDVTEDQLDQAIYDAQHQKSVDESDEFMRLDKRNRDETLALFKVMDIVPHEEWDHKQSNMARKYFFYN
jgi:hypothetical protein